MDCTIFFSMKLFLVYLKIGNLNQFMHLNTLQIYLWKFMLHSLLDFFPVQFEMRIGFLPTHFVLAYADENEETEFITQLHLFHPTIFPLN